MPFVRLPSPCLAALSLALAGCSTAPGSNVAVPTVPPPPSLSLDTLKSVTETLSSDAFEGRAPATPGEDKTVALIAERFAAAGLKPGNNGSWFQDVPLVETIGKNITPITVRDATTSVRLDYRRDMVVSTYRVTPRVDIKDSEIVFVGYGINAPEKGWNDYAGIDMRGKTALILINDPDWQKPTVGGEFNGRAMTYYGRWTYKYEEAARQGATAAIIIHDTEPAAYGWNVVDSSWTGPQITADAANGHMDQIEAIGWIQKDAARRIMGIANQSLDSLIAAAGRKGFKPVPLGVTASLSFDNDIRRQASKNVIGILPGKDRPDEYVLYSAHWDHLGRCNADATGDDICNGALDNATGTAGLITLAEAHAKAGPAARSIIFLAVTAEESGLLGSAYYAANPIYPLGRTAGGINMDGLNIYGPTRDVVVVGGGKSELEAYLDKAVAAQGRTISAEPTPEKGFYYRSDHFSFAKLGVPMLYYDSGEDLVNGGRAAGAKIAEDYTANRYHQPSDEYDPDWNWDGALADLTLNYQIGRMLADGSTWPNWLRGDEFRAIRDASRNK